MTYSRDTRVFWAFFEIDFILGKITESTMGALWELAGNAGMDTSSKWEGGKRLTQVI